MNHAAQSRLRFDEALFLALIAALPIMQLPLLELRGRYPIPLADALFLVTGVALTIAVMRGQRSVRLAGWPVAVIAYLAVSALAATFSIAPRESLIKLAGVTYLCGLGVMTVQYVTSGPALRRAVTAWLVGTAVTIAATLAGVALFYVGVTSSANMFLFSFGSLPPGPYPRVKALFLNANMLCTYAAAGVMIGLAAEAAGWVRRWAGRALLAGGLLTAALTLSPGLGGLLLALSLWYARALAVQWPRAARLAPVAGGMAVALFFVVTLISAVPFVRGLQSEAGLPTIRPSGRLYVWIRTWDRFLEYPLLGRGLGIEVQDAHNLWLSVMAQQGILGLLAFALVVGALVLRFRPVRTRGSDVAVLRTGLELALVAGLLFSSLSGSFEDTRHLWVLMGLVASVQALPSQDPAPAGTTSRSSDG